MNELATAAFGGVPRSMEFCRRLSRFQMLSGVRLAAVSAAVFVIAGCVPDMRGSDISQPHYANPLNELELSTLDNAQRQPASIASDRPDTRYVQARRGDTIATVAERTGADPATLAEANGISAGTPLYAGQLIKIPDAPPQTAGAQDIGLVASSAFESIETREPNPLQDTDPSFVSSEQETTEFAEQVSGLFAPDDDIPLPSAANDPLPENIEPVDLPASPQFSQYQTQETATRFLFPVEGEIVREYSNAPGGNEGIDIAAPAGTVVVAAGDGEVALISWSADQTAILLIRHPDAFYTVYANLKGVTVEKGDQIARGQPLGAVAGGDKEFLHFEIRKGTESVDPMPYIS